jgi:hypothetical protein
MNVHRFAGKVRPRMVHDPAKKFSLLDHPGGRVLDEGRDRIFVLDEFIAIQIEERHHRQFGRPLVRVDERMVLNEKVRVRCSFLRDRLVRVLAERALLCLENRRREQVC